MNRKYPLPTRAYAVEQIRKGRTLTGVAKEIGCGIQTVSRWWLDYRGYRGEEGVTITLKSKIK